MATPTKVLYIRIPDKLHGQVREIADDEGVSITFMVVTLLREAVKGQQRDEQRIKELEAQLALYQSSIDNAERREAS